MDPMSEGFATEPSFDTPNIPGLPGFGIPANLPMVGAHGRELVSQRQAEAHYAQKRAAERASLDKFLAWFRLQLDLEDAQTNRAGGASDRWHVDPADDCQVVDGVGLRIDCAKGPMLPAVAAHIAAWSPDRATWESDAKRAVIGYVMDDFDDDDQYACERIMGILLPLAYVYHHQAGWDDAWTT